MDKNHPKAPMYYCDPAKNTDCSKQHCFYSDRPPFTNQDCKATMNADCALTDPSGNPVPFDRNSEGVICYVRGRIGIFRGYFQHSNIRQAVMIGDIGGTVSFPVAVVEYPDDGTVEEVELRSIRFKRNPADVGGSEA